MSEERKRILSMLKDGKISLAEAEELLDAIGGAEKTDEKRDEHVESSGAPKYLRVVVTPGKGKSNGENVNIRVPLQLIRAGIKLGSVIPNGVQSKVDHALKEKGIGIDLKDLKSSDLESLIEGLTDMSIDVDSEDEKVRIFCE
jgi:hypothetical protein